MSSRTKIFEVYQALIYGIIDNMYDEVMDMTIGQLHQLNNINSFIICIFNRSTLDAFCQVPGNNDVVCDNIQEMFIRLRNAVVENKSREVAKICRKFVEMDFISEQDYQDAIQKRWIRTEYYRDIFLAHKKFQMFIQDIADNGLHRLFEDRVDLEEIYDTAKLLEHYACDVMSRRRNRTDTQTEDVYWYILTATELINIVDYDDAENVVARNAQLSVLYDAIRINYPPLPYDGE